MCCAFVVAPWTDTPISVSFLSIWTEKKLLHYKLRNVPANEKATTAIEKPTADKRDASTATEDLGANIKHSFICSSWFISTIFFDVNCVYLDTGESSSSETLTSTVDTLEDAGTSVLRSNNISDFPSLEEASSSIPDDQLRMIDNINSLMSEVISLMCRNPEFFLHQLEFPK